MWKEVLTEARKIVTPCRFLSSLHGHRKSSQTYLTVIELKPGLKNANSISTRSKTCGSKTIQLRKQTAGIVVENNEIFTRLDQSNNCFHCESLVMSLIEKHQQMHTWQREQDRLAITSSACDPEIMTSWLLWWNTTPPISKGVSQEISGKKYLTDLIWSMWHCIIHVATYINMNRVGHIPVYM